MVDDHAMFREGLARVLEKEPGFKVVGQCGSSTEALAALSSSGATMVLLDVDLGSEKAMDFVTDARRKGFEGQFLSVTAGSSDPQTQALRYAPGALMLPTHNSP